MLVIANAKCAVCDDDAVCGTEVLFYPTREIYSLFNQDVRVGAGLLGGFHMLKDVSSIAGSTILRFFTVPGQLLGRILGLLAQCLAVLILAKAVCVDAFRCVVAAFILVAFTKPCRRRTVESAIGRGGGENCMSIR